MVTQDLFESAGTPTQGTFSGLDAVATQRTGEERLEANNPRNCRG